MHVIGNVTSLDTPRLGTNNKQVSNYQSNTNKWGLKYPPTIKVQFFSPPTSDNGTFDFTMAGKENAHSKMKVENEREGGKDSQKNRE